MSNIQASLVRINLFSGSDQHAREEVQSQAQGFLNNQSKEVKFLDAKLMEDGESTTIMVITYTTAL